MLALPISRAAAIGCCSCISWQPHTAAQEASIKEAEQYKELGRRRPETGMFYEEYVKRVQKGK